VIRAAAARDIEAVLALWGGNRSAHAVTADTVERVAPLVESGALLVAEVDGAVVGAVIAAFDGWRGFRPPGELPGGLSPIVVANPPDGTAWRVLRRYDGNSPRTIRTDGPLASLPCRS
jgi:hypothetical protein